MNELIKDLTTGFYPADFSRIYSGLIREIWSHLKGMSNFTDLNLSRNGLPCNAHATLETIFSGISKVSSLDLSENDLFKVQDEQLLELFKYISKVTYLNLASKS